jgi:hypothetical protein
MLPHSDFVYDKNGIYERQYDSRVEKVFNVKFPFAYGAKVSAQNTFITDNSRYIVYGNQAYDPWDKKMYKLTTEQIELAKQNKLLLADNPQKNQIDQTYDYKLYKANGRIYWNDKPTIADADTFENLAGYYKDKNHVYWYDRSNGLEIVNGLDAASAQVRNGFITDKTNLYLHKRAIISSKQIELLAVCAGYRMGCGLDTHPQSNYYFFRNADGYWLVLISDVIKIRPLGQTLDRSLANQLNLTAQ